MVVDALGPLLGSGDSRVSVAVAASFARLTEEQYGHLNLMSLWSSGGEEMRQGVLSVISLRANGDGASARATGLLRLALRDVSTRVRQHALQIVSSGPIWVQPLREEVLAAAMDGSALVRGEALWALNQLGREDVDAWTLLQAACDDADEDVQSTARRIERSRPRWTARDEPGPGPGARDPGRFACPPAPRGPHGAHTVAVEQGRPRDPRPRAGPAPDADEAAGGHPGRAAAGV